MHRLNDIYAKLFDLAKRFWGVILTLALIFLIASIIGGLFLGWAWPGFAGKSFWDLLGLAIIPIALAFFAAWFRKVESEKEAKREELERELENDRQWEAILQTYLDQMKSLLISTDLNLQKPDNKQIQTITRTLTLTTLQRLDGVRKMTVLRFLNEAGLIRVRKSVISLRGANLIEAELKGPVLRDFEMIDLNTVNLSFAKLSGINLRGAELKTSFLAQTDLTDSTLEMADLSGSILSEAVLIEANLHEATLTNTNLIGANLSGTDLSDARLVGANLSETVLSGAVLIGAALTRANLSKANLSPLYTKTDQGNAYWLRTDLNNADLNEAKLLSANLSEATLDGANLYKTEYNNATIWPDGFDPKAAGAINVDEKGQ